ncbi:MAG TPA: hypothetical protein VJU14_06220 [Solirubrobacterales bacterium]|nr:hypothetical protein [Solirubrobacterales bacterium]
MRNFKKLGALAAVVLALSAIGAANASAALFTASATGSLVGFASSTQIFTTNGGQIKCSSALPSGTIQKVADTQQHVTVNYGKCTAFGFATVHVTPATYSYTAGGALFGEVHILNTITVTVTGGGCDITIGPQAVRQVFYYSNGPRVVMSHDLHEIAYKSTGGLCGAGGTNGTFQGGMEIERLGGGSLAFDH